MSSSSDSGTESESGAKFNASVDPQFAVFTSKKSCDGIQKISSAATKTDRASTGNADDYSDAVDKHIRDRVAKVLFAELDRQIEVNTDSVETTKNNCPGYIDNDAIFLLKSSSQPLVNRNFVSAFDKGCEYDDDTTKSLSLTQSESRHHKHKRRKSDNLSDKEVESRCKLAAVSFDWIMQHAQSDPS